MRYVKSASLRMRAPIGWPSRASSVALLIMATVAFGCVMILSLLLSNPTTRLAHAIVQLDQNLVIVLNGLARRSWGFDVLVWELAYSIFVQGVMVALFWGAWFAPNDNLSASRQKRETMLASLIGLHASAVFAIALRAALPFRARPVLDPAIVFQAPYSPFGGGLPSNSTSLPAGHAAVFFALAVGLWSISVTLGVLGSLQAL